MNSIFRSKTYFAFWITLLEWYEFTIYNLMVPYGIFGSSNDGAMYLGFIIFALSFLARPIGSVYFMYKTDRTQALRESLRLMLISTFLIGLFPPFLAPIKVLWFASCKVLQGFAIGGSYGLSYLKVYQAEIKKNGLVNYKLAIVQCGWIIGWLAGTITMLIIKLLVGNLGLVNDLIARGQWQALLSIKPTSEFISYGWRLPFLFSGIIATIIYYGMRHQPSDVVVSMSDNPFLYGLTYLKRKPIKFISVFLVVAIDMVISHIWFTYCGTASEASNPEVATTISMVTRLALLLIALPLFGLVTDYLNKIIDRKGNYLVLALVCASMILAGFFAPWSTKLWLVISALVAAGCYGSLIAWTIQQFNNSEADMLIGTMFNLSSALVGSMLPLIATYVTGKFGMWAVGGIMTIYGISALTCLCIRFTADN